MYCSEGLISLLPPFKISSHNEAAKRTLLTEAAVVDRDNIGRDLSFVLVPAAEIQSITRF